ncbi:MAG: patatin-like phospholipase family protein [Kordiimonas sp.]
MFDVSNSLVLSGGNVKGAYQAGAVKALLNHTFLDGSKFEPGGIFGVSVGSMNGGFLADRAGRAALAGKDPNWGDIGSELEAFWRDNITSFASIGKKRGAFSLAFSIIGGKFNGLTTMDGAAHLARANISAENLKASKTFYACGVTNMATGSYFNADVGTFGDKILDYVIASTREPVSMPLMWVDSQPLADGGLRNIAPLKPAIKMGTNKMAVIAMKPDHMSVVDAKKEFGHIMKLLKRTIGTLTSEIMNNDLNQVRKINTQIQAELASGAQTLTSGKRIIEFLEVRPEERLPINVTKFDTNDIQNLISMGERDAKAQLENGWLTGETTPQ